MSHTVKNPAYPLDLNLIVDHIDPDWPDGPRRREYMQHVSSDELTFDRTQPFFRPGQEVGFLGKRWTVEEPTRRQEPPEGGEAVDWVVMEERPS